MRRTIGILFEPLANVFAAADIGSNTVHLLVARVDRGGLEELEDRSVWVGLGEAVAREGAIPSALAKSVSRAVARFVQVSKDCEAKGCYLFATESFRRAEGATALAERIEAKTGLPVEIVKPEREAELGLRGALLDSDGPSPALFAECGGGSVQLARFVEDRAVWERSLRLGTGTLKAEMNLVQPTDEESVVRVREYIRRSLPPRSHFDGVVRLVASGGVARGLVRALHPDGERALHRQELEYLAWATAGLTRSQVEARFRVKPQRAATLLPGALVFLEVMASASLDKVTVSEYGVREGAVLEMACGGFKKWCL
ncbi:MAG: hypothetical protein IT207_00790 [Fimbriimonadaceae bacterium]|nr:hypothetical protein [Fimbriimonadaceae bacterium]